MYPNYSGCPASATSKQVSGYPLLKVSEWIV